MEPSARLSARARQRLERARKQIRRPFSVSVVGPSPEHREGAQAANDTLPAAHKFHKYKLAKKLMPSVWMTAPTDAAFALQRPAKDGTLSIIAVRTKQGGA